MEMLVLSVLNDQIKLGFFTKREGNSLKRLF